MRACGGCSRLEKLSFAGSQVGQVYARISSRKQRLENIVEVFLRTPLPFLPQLGKVVLNLEHKMEVISMEPVYACVLVCALGVCACA